MDSETMRTTFRSQGYVVLDNIISEQEAAHYVQLLEALSGKPLTGENPVHWNCKDGIWTEQGLWPLLFNSRLLTAARIVLNSDAIRYTEQSDLKIWRYQQASGWHRDSVDEQPGSGADWSDSYSVIRVAFYLQPSKHHFAWGAIPGSHRYEHIMQPWERNLWAQWLPASTPHIPSRLSHLTTHEGRLWIRATRSHRLWEPPTEPVWVPTRPTHTILFDPRVIHAGGPVTQSKAAIFFSLGLDNDHSRRHATHFVAPYRSGSTQARDAFAHRLKQAKLA